VGVGLVAALVAPEVRVGAALLVGRREADAEVDDEGVPPPEGVPRPQRRTASRSSVTVSRAAARLGTSMELWTRSW
jgi:hypothetical protein